MTPGRGPYPPTQQGHGDRNPRFLIWSTPSFITYKLQKMKGIEQEIFLFPRIFSRKISVFLPVMSPYGIAYNKMSKRGDAFCRELLP